MSDRSSSSSEKETVSKVASEEEKQSSDDDDLIQEKPIEVVNVKSSLPKYIFIHTYLVFIYALFMRAVNISVCDNFYVIVTHPSTVESFRKPKLTDVVCDGTGIAGEMALYAICVTLLIWISGNVMIVYFYPLVLYRYAYNTAYTVFKFFVDSEFSISYNYTTLQSLNVFAVFLFFPALILLQLYMKPKFVNALTEDTVWSLVPKIKFL